LIPEILNKLIVSQKIFRCTNWKQEPTIKPETSSGTKTKVEPVPEQNETTPIDEKPIINKPIPKTETEIEKPTETQPTSDKLTTKYETKKTWYRMNL
jgi:hypothetical protein